MDPSDTLKLAINIVRSACRISRALQDKMVEDLGTQTKGDSSPVTVADFAIQAVVGQLLDQPFVGEEGGDLLEDQPDLRLQVLHAAQIALPGWSEKELMRAIRLGEGLPQTDSFWTLDPIDGTKGFIRKAHYCTALAYIHENQPTVGVLGCPRLSSDPSSVDGEGALFWAVRDQQAFCEEQPIQISSWLPGTPVVVTESAESAHSDHSLANKVLKAAAIPSATPLRLDSQVKYAVVARGQAQVFIRKSRDGYVEKIWDHAAGSLIAETAGCRVTDLNGNRLDFSTGIQLENNRGVLVAPAALHEKMLTTFEQLPS
ncbi:MAG: hypothetical protein KTR25_01825 [Myxococcales bacterium]|nr:hypothetical protein [Myxococcales bacterium]